MNDPRTVAVKTGQRILLVLLAVAVCIAASGPLLDSLSAAGNATANSRFAAWFMEHRFWVGVVGGIASAAFGVWCFMTGLALEKLPDNNPDDKLNTVCGFGFPLALVAWICFAMAALSTFDSISELSLYRQLSVLALMAPAAALALAAVYGFIVGMSIRMMGD